MGHGVYSNAQGQANVPDFDRVLEIKIPSISVPR